MKQMSNITAIIPIHEYNDVFIEYLKNCITSIKNQELMFDDVFLVVPKEFHKQYSEFINNMECNVTVISNTGNDTTYQSQVMLGVNNVNSEYFTVLEFDDELSSKYLKNMVLYLNKYENVKILLPTILEVNSENKKIKETNIQAWSKQLVGDDNDIGYLNEKLLLEYTDFKLSGSVINKKTFLKLNGFKNNVSFLFGFEFLLRALKNNIKIFVLPKILYKHLSNRIDSITEYHIRTLTPKQIKTWFDIAINESNINDN